MNDWPPRLGESFPPVLKEKVINDSSRRVVIAKRLLIASTVLVSLFICVTVVYGAIRGQASDTKTITYRVEPGDTLWGIAAKYDPNANTMQIVSEIEQLNHLDDNSFLQVNKQLIVPEE